MENDFYRYIPLDLTNIETESYKTSIPIKDATLNIVIRKPSISEFYYLDVLDSSLEPIVQGVRLQPHINIMRGIKDSRYPEIRICPMYTNEIGLKTDLKFPSLGTNFSLMLIDKEAVEEQDDATIEG